MKFTDDMVTKTRAIALIVASISVNNYSLDESDRELRFFLELLLTTRAASRASPREKLRRPFKHPFESMTSLTTGSSAIDLTGGVFAHPDFNIEANEKVAA